MFTILFTVLCCTILLFVTHTDAFLQHNSFQNFNNIPHKSTSILNAVDEVTSIDSFEAVVSTDKKGLVIIDYSTTWCGPCKMVLPRFEELSEKFTDVTFLKCIGDLSAEASALMKREGVRSVPTFHIWKDGIKVDVVNGARIEDVEAALLAAK